MADGHFKGQGFGQPVTGALVHPHSEQLGVKSDIAEINGGDLVISE